MERVLHIKWIARVFAPLMPPNPHPQVLDLLAVATDVLTWKVLRRDRGFSKPKTIRAMKFMAVSALQPPENPS